MNDSVLHIWKKKRNQKKDRLLSDLNHSRAFTTDSTTSCEKSQILDEMDCNIFTKESKEHNLRLSLRPHKRGSDVI